MFTFAVWVVPIAVAALVALSAAVVGLALALARRPVANVVQSSNSSVALAGYMSRKKDKFNSKQIKVQ